jgi:hypothetical protein
LLGENGDLRSRRRTVVPYTVTLRNPTLPVMARRCGCHE